MVYRCFYRDLPPVGCHKFDQTEDSVRVVVKRPQENLIIIKVWDKEQKSWILQNDEFELPTLKDDPTPREKCQCIFTIGYYVGVARLAAIDPEEIF